MRDWLYVEDHCRAIWRGARRRPARRRSTTIGGDCEQTNLDVVRTHLPRSSIELRPGLPHAPCTSLITFVADRPGHDRRYAIDAGKIRRELGWRPEENFESGLRRTVHWYLDNLPWVARLAAASISAGD